MVWIKGIFKSSFSSHLVKSIHIIISEVLFESLSEFLWLHCRPEASITSVNIAVSACTILSIVNWLGMDTWKLVSRTTVFQWWTHSSWVELISISFHFSKSSIVIKNIRISSTTIQFVMNTSFNFKIQLGFMTMWIVLECSFYWGLPSLRYTKHFVFLMKIKINLILYKNKIKF